MPQARQPFSAELQEVRPPPAEHVDTVERFQAKGDPVEVPDASAWQYAALLETLEEERCLQKRNRQSEVTRQRQVRTVEQFVDFFLKRAHRAPCRIQHEPIQECDAVLQTAMDKVSRVRSCVLPFVERVQRLALERFNAAE